MRLLAICLFLAVPHVSVAWGTDDDIVIADFEGDSYGSWQATGEAFGNAPARGTLPNQMEVTGYRGQGLVNSFRGGDDATGTLTSPPFKIERDFLNFLIGGGQHPDKTCINLIVRDEVVRTATGPNDRPGGSERLEWATWDVTQLRGEEAILQIVDRQEGGWGHINVDQIVQSNQRAETTEQDRRRQIALAHQYLLFPIDNQAAPCRMKIIIDDQLIQDFDINLAVDKVDWWARLDMSGHQGRVATVRVDRLPFGSQGLKLVESSDQVRHLQPLYNERLRPQLRFSQMRGWNNDPNGMVYYDGEWHLFWQSNPFGPKWANMFWGHAVSRDLVHWQELPFALYPRVMAVDHCFSGSANVDRQNTGGWQAGENKVLVAAFTDTGCGEAIAISKDRGRNWKYIDENPVIEHRGRDPKLVWYEPGRHWVIAVYDEHDGSRDVAFYTSKNLTDWQYQSRLQGFFECPELFELPVDNDPQNRKWVVYAADAQYVVGDFDGKVFTPEHEGKRRLHYGAYYASQCFNCAPQGRVIQIGWARVEMPEMPFNQAFSLPTELRLVTTTDGVSLRAEPIAELDVLRGEPRRRTDQRLAADKPLQLEFDGQLCDIEVEIANLNADAVRLAFGENEITYDIKAARLGEMPLKLDSGLLALRVVVDRPMYELVGGRGVVYKTAARRDGGQPLGAIKLTAIGGDAELRRLTVYPMRSIWPKNSTVD